MKIRILLVALIAAAALASTMIGQAFACSSYCPRGMNCLQVCGPTLR